MTPMKDLFSKYEVPAKTHTDLLVELSSRYITGQKPSPEDWQIAEAAIGFTLPTSFKRIDTAFGHGKFGEYMSLISPAAHSPQDRFGPESLMAIESLVEDPPHSLRDKTLVRFAWVGDHFHLCFTDLPPAGAGCSEEGRIVLVRHEMVECLRLGFGTFMYRYLFNRPPLSGSVSSLLHGLFMNGCTDLFRPISKWPPG